MQVIVKFLWLAIILAVIEIFFPVFRDFYLAHQFGAMGIPSATIKRWEIISYLFIGLKNVASAGWLFWLASKDNQSKLVWSLVGLIFGLIAVVLYYLVRINEKTKT